MNESHVHTLVVVFIACLAGSETSKGNYGWAVTFGLLFFAVLKN